MTGAIATADPQSVEWVARRPASDYQEYLAEYVADFTPHRLAMWRDGPGRLVRLGSRQHPQALARVVAQPWDTACLGLDVARIALLAGADTTVKQRLLEDIKRQARACVTRLLTCRVGHHDLSSLHALEAAGFRTMDVMSIFLGDQARLDGCRSRPAHSDPADTEIHLLEDPDLDTRRTLRALAAGAFRHGRVANDPTFTPQQVAAFYGGLFESDLEADGSVLLVARRGGRIVGFVLGGEDLALRRHLDLALGYLNLIAVDPVLTGQGIGCALVREFLTEMYRRVRLVEVGTQINNYAALNLYYGAGLKCVSALVTLHLWL